MLPYRGLSVCMSSVTLVHPANAVGRNEIPFGRDTHVGPSNTVFGQELLSPSPQDGLIRSMPPIAKLVRPLLDSTTQRWNRVSGSRVTGSAILAGSGRVTGQCVRPVFDPVLRFNMRVYRGVVSTQSNTISAN